MYNKYGDNEYSPKICPLTGETISPEHGDYECLTHNCRNVSKEKWEILYDRKVHCEKERKDVKRVHEERIKKIMETKLLRESLETAKTINVDEFFRYCDIIDEMMINKLQDYSPNMLINPYHAEGEKCLIYLCEGMTVSEISVVDNVFNYLGTRFNKYKEHGMNFSVSCCRVPGYLAEAINVRLHLQYKMDVKSILHNNNPVYIKARSIGKYVKSVYGYEWWEFKNIRNRHLELTEIANYDNVLYIKQEIDEIIRRGAADSTAAGIQRRCTSRGISNRASNHQ